MLKSVQIKNRTLEIPVIQGGMGVGVSLSGLAGNVMKNGGMGVISAAHPGYRHPDFRKNPLRANCRAIVEEVKKAREISQGRGLVGVNIMVAARDYKELVQATVAAGADAIISGAGLPLSLPEYTHGADILLAPVVSSGKAARLISVTWDKRYSTVPDFVIIEGCMAGGHLGFKKEDLATGSCQTLEEILPQVQQALQPYREKYSKNIPVFVAGGIYDGADVAHFIRLGADGVQMGTRFIATEECDAHPAFKQALVTATAENIAIVQSPAGFPGRAVVNKFINDTKQRGNIAVQRCLACLTPCTPGNTPYCITDALIQTVSGNIDNGLVFTGTNGARIDGITTVRSLMTELIAEAEKALQEEK
ncbi:MAG: nitronate monooxygenase [Oscillospiraceae bacterium]|nr:nitronate monooxygenase [Oscillospiraceae bacterium]